MPSYTELVIEKYQREQGGNKKNTKPVSRETAASRFRAQKTKFDDDHLVDYFQKMHPRKKLKELLEKPLKEIILGDFEQVVRNSISVIIADQRKITRPFFDSELLKAIDEATTLRELIAYRNSVC